MRSNPSLISLFLISAIVIFSNAHAISKEPTILETRGDDDTCPNNRAVCGAGDGKPRFVRLAPRMKLPGDEGFRDMNDFMKKQTEAARNVVTDPSQCTAVYSALGESGVNWAVNGMCGCTSLIVVSEKATYFTHYFEDLAFCADAPKSSDFQRQVLGALEDGTSTQESLRHHASDFRDQTGLAAFIMTPTTGKSSSLQYKSKIARLQSKVDEIIGLTPKIISYVPEDGATSKQLLKNALGTALFQYDPKQNKDDPKALTKVWIEKSEEYSHTWSGPSAQVDTSGLPKCAGTPTSTPQVAFPQPDADALIRQFCSNRAYWNLDIVPLVSFGTGLTSDGRHKALGASDSFPINEGTDNLWLGLSFKEDSCVGSFPFTFGTNDDERLAHCVDRFRIVLNGCNTDTTTAKFGGELDDVCSVYRMTARKSGQADPMTLKSQTDPGTFTCNPT